MESPSDKLRPYSWLGSTLLNIISMLIVHDWKHFRHVNRTLSVLPSKPIAEAWKKVKKIIYSQYLNFKFYFSLGILWRFSLHRPLGQYNLLVTRTNRRKYIIGYNIPNWAYQFPNWWYLIQLGICDLISDSVLPDLYEMVNDPGWFLVQAVLLFWYPD